MFTGMTPIYLLVALSLMAHALVARRYGWRGAAWCLGLGLLCLFLFWAAMSAWVIVRTHGVWEDYRFSVGGGAAILAAVIGFPYAIGGVLGGLVGLFLRPRAPGTT